MGKSNGNGNLPKNVAPSLKNEYGEEKQGNSLATLNDSKKYSFKKIANVIQRYYKVL